MKIIIMRAMRGEFPSMDVYADGLAGGLRAEFADWEIVEMEPPVRFNSQGQGKLTRAVNGLARYADRFWKYPAAVVAAKADVVHVMSDHHFQIARWLKGTRTRSVATCHDLIFYRFRKNLEQFAAFLGVSRTAQEFCMRSLRWCDHVITLSQDNVNDLQSILGVKPERISVIHNAVAGHFRPPVAGEREAARKRLGIRDGQFAMVHVGTVEPRKNVDSILSALAVLRDENVVFVKVGIDFTDAQNALIETAGIRGNILHLGKLPNTEVVAVYHACDALIFPSLYEGFPFPIGEAMASDLPVITSTASSLPEVAGGAALLVDPFDIAQITDAIRSLQTDPVLRASQIAKGRVRVGKLTWRENARQVADLYGKLISSR